MRAREFLFEYRRDITAKKLGDKLLAWLKKHTTDWDDEKWTPERKQKTIDSLLQVIEYVDPTENKQYVVWLINSMFREGSINREAEMVLRLFELAKKNNVLEPQHRDINQFKTIPELKAMLETYSEDEIYMGKAQVRNVYKDDKLSVDIPLNQAGSCKIGHNTKWCTAATKSDNYFDSYNDEGPLWVITPKNRQYERYLIHFPRGEFADEVNKQVSILKLFSMFPQIRPILDRPENWNEMLKRGLWDKRLRGEDEELPTYLATKYPQLIANDENVSEYFDNIDPEALENNEELIKGALKHGVSLGSIPRKYRNQYEFIKSALEGNGKELRNVPINILKTHPELIDISLEQDWWNLKYLTPELMTEELIREALEHSEYLINYIPTANLTPEIILDVIDKYGPTEKGLTIIGHLKHDPEKFGVDFWRKLLEKNEEYKMLIPNKDIWNMLSKAGLVQGEY